MIFLIPGSKVLGHWALGEDDLHLGLAVLAGVLGVLEVELLVELGGLRDPALLAVVALLVLVLGVVVRVARVGDVIPVVVLEI